MSNSFLAYGEEHHAVEAIMRMHSVKRWHMIDTTRQQTLAEHSSNVAVLVSLLVIQVAKKFAYRLSGMDAGDMILAALTHDVVESFTGDIPTHTKKFLTGLGSMESRVLPDEFNILITDDVKLLIKLCDLADGIRFIRLHGVDMTATHARHGLEKQFGLKGTEAFDVWPSEVVHHILKTLSFYAYENS